MENFEPSKHGYSWLLVLDLEARLAPSSKWHLRLRLTFTSTFVKHQVLTNKMNKIIDLLGTRSLATNEMKADLRRRPLFRTELNKMQDLRDSRYSAKKWKKNWASWGTFCHIWKQYSIFGRKLYHRIFCSPVTRIYQSNETVCIVVKPR
jgi:hypothetical protein